MYEKLTVSVLVIFGLAFWCVVITLVWMVLKS